MKIGLIFGGKSFEHDISIITANLIYHALKEKHQIFLIYIDRTGDINFVKNMQIDDFVDEKKFKKVKLVKGGFIYAFKRVELDILISAMHGTNGEDGLASIVANLYDIPFVGSPSIQSGTIMDKYFTYAVLRANNIKTLPTKFYFKHDEILLKKYPVIIKPARLGSSIGINVVLDENELFEKAELAFKFDNKIIIQPLIENFKEYNQAAYSNGENVILSNVEEVFKTDDILSFDDKYITSKTEKQHAFITDENIIEKISKITNKIYKIFELSGVVRVDYMMFDNEIYVNEINTTPGSFAYYLFEDGLENLLEKLIKNALFEYQMNRDYVFKSSVLSQKYNYKK